MKEDRRRAVHAFSDDLRIVRYEAGGKWFVEGQRRRYKPFDKFVLYMDHDGQPVYERFTNNVRKRLTVEQAVECAAANRLQWIRGVPGGTVFDRLVAPHELEVANDDD